MPRSRVATKSRSRSSTNASGRPPTLDERAAGILLHVTSLPGGQGSGDFGPSARRFADFLERACHRWWQMLPLNPVGPGFSPYSGVSAFAGNPLLISLDDLAEEGLLDRASLEGPRWSSAEVDYPRADAFRQRALRAATERLLTSKPATAALRRELRDFRERAADWLDDYALFMALRDAHGGASWTTWERELVRRERGGLSRARSALARAVAHYEAEQFLFDRQWRALRAYCAERGIGVIGDAPIFVAHESADVWANARYFRLDRAGRPTHVAGVPPDYFSKTGQRWGNPLYRWPALARDGFAWWLDRLRLLADRFDVVRLDHFLGFVRYWEIPAEHETAEHGAWRDAPGSQLFAAVRKALGATPFIAEDLGSVTPEVRALRDEHGMPGMRVLQFAFGNDPDAQIFLPHAYVPRSVAYTGTHDNDTIVGWFEDRGGGEGNPRSVQQASRERKTAIRYLAGPDARRLARPVHEEMLRVLYGSVASTVIVPMQDALGLGNEARMNVPGAGNGCWAWRLRDRQATDRIAARLASLAQTYGRVARSA